MSTTETNGTPQELTEHSSSRTRRAFVKVISLIALTVSGGAVGQVVTHPDGEQMAQLPCPDRVDPATWQKHETTIRLLARVIIDAGLSPRNFEPDSRERFLLIELFHAVISVIVHTDPEIV